MSAGDEGLPRHRRLRKSSDYRRIQRSGRRMRGKHFVVLYEANGLDGPRVGFAVSRKVGNAVVRNRVKRWLREGMRRCMSRLGGVDVVLIAKPSAATAGFVALHDAVNHAFSSITTSARGVEA